MNRRRLLLGAGAAGVLASLGGVGYSALSKDRPLALVYRGPAACSGCAESVAALLESSPTRFRTQFCGPDEDVQISAETLAGAAVYAQPGGGSVKSAWRRLRDHAQDIRDFVHNGGHYLGFCLGAYLAADSPGFGLLSGVTVEGYIYSDEASVHDTDDTIVQVRWRGQLRHMYFQDGNLFRVQPGAPATVIATYDTGAPAAIIATYGAGRLGLVGPHPEADQAWYDGAGLTNPDGIRFDLGHDLIESTVHGEPPQA
ncbi:MAG TPA: BPL-N domain-containing protein [Micromonosporaceae bacterium]